RRHTRFSRDWSSDVCSSDLTLLPNAAARWIFRSSPCAGALMCLYALHRATRCDLKSRARYSGLPVSSLDSPYRNRPNYAIMALSIHSIMGTLAGGVYVVMRPNCWLTPRLIAGLIT